MDKQLPLSAHNKTNKQTSNKRRNDWINAWELDDALSSSAAVSATATFGRTVGSEVREAAGVSVGGEPVQKREVNAVVNAVQDPIKGLNAVVDQTRSLQPLGSFGRDLSSQPARGDRDHLDEEQGSEIEAKVQQSNSSREISDAAKKSIDAAVESMAKVMAIGTAVQASTPLAPLVVSVGKLTLDESSGLQNSASSAAAGDKDDNDIQLDLVINGQQGNLAVPDFPAVFETRLKVLPNADPASALGVALSGYDGSTWGQSFLSWSSSLGGITPVGFVNSAGTPLDGLAWTFNGKDVKTTDGKFIFLYTDTTNPRILLGRLSDTATANPNGGIAFALYLDDQIGTNRTAATTADDTPRYALWSIQYKSLSHPIAGNSDLPIYFDDALSLANLVYFKLAQDYAFDLTGVPSGNQLFLQFGDGNLNDHLPGEPEIGIVATGLKPADQSAGKNVSSGDTVNTSQADPPTSFSSNNQNITPGNGLAFTFVTNPDPNYTVARNEPKLTAVEAKVEKNILFDGVYNSRAASFYVVKFVSGKPTAKLTLTAYAVDHDNNPLTATPNRSQDAFINGNGLTGDIADDGLTITSVSIVRNGQTLLSGQGGITVQAADGSRSMIISGLKEKDQIRYTTSRSHSRIYVKNSGNASTADFNIGLFQLTSAQASSFEVGSSISFEDDGPIQPHITPSGSPELLTFDGGLKAFGGNYVGPESVSDLNSDAVIASAQLADGQNAFYSISDPILGADLNGTRFVENKLKLWLAEGQVSLASGLFSGGEEIMLSINGAGTLVTGSIAMGAVTVFTIALEDYNQADSIPYDRLTLTQLRPLDHLNVDLYSGQYIGDVLKLAKEKISLLVTVKDVDGDTDYILATVEIDLENKVQFGDDGPIKAKITASDTPVLLTFDGGLAAGNYVGEEAVGDDDVSAVIAKVNLSDFYILSVLDAGADSGSRAVSHSLTIKDASSGLKSGGKDVTLTQVGNVITGATADGTVFVLTLDDVADTLELKQLRALDHGTAQEYGGAYLEDVLQLTSGKIELSVSVKDTDGDQDYVIAEQSIDLGGNIQFGDDGPIKAKITASDTPVLLTFDGGLAAGNYVGEEAVGDDDVSAVIAKVNLSDFYILSVLDAGADSGSRAVSHSLTIKDGSSGLKSGGKDVTLTQVGNVITGATADGTVFVLTLDDVADTLELKQLRALDHGTAQEYGGAYLEDVLQLTSGKIELSVSVKDTDGDQDYVIAEQSIDLGGNIQFGDDGPRVTEAPVSDPTPTITPGSPGLWTYSGDFAYRVGSDQRSAFSILSSDFGSFTLTGTVNGRNISSPSIVWSSESNLVANFAVQFGYDEDGKAETPPASTATGVLTFDKLNGVYEFKLNALKSSQEFTLGEGSGYASYPLGESTPKSGPQPVATGKLGDNFYIQLTGFNAPLTAGPAPAQKTFAEGELISGSTDSVTLSSTALGVSGNTIQAGEAADIQFFGYDPKGFLTNEGDKRISSFFIKFDGFETETDDLVVVLGLERLDSNGQILAATSRALYVDQGDVFEDDDYNPLKGTKYESIVTNDPLDPADTYMDNNDGLLIVEANDYNVNAGDDWVVRTVQVLSTADGITGQAINLNRNVGISGGSPADPLNNINNDTSSGPIKIIDAGFATANIIPPAMNIALGFAISDFDQDRTASQSIQFVYPPVAPLPGAFPLFPSNPLMTV